MAALSFSPSPPSPTTTNQGGGGNGGGVTGSGTGTGKENPSTKSAVTPLGASKSFGKITVHNVLSESGGNSLQQHIANQNTIIRKIKDFGMLGAVHSAAAASTTISTITNTTTMGSRKRSLAEINKFQNKSTNLAGKRSKSSKKTMAKEKNAAAAAAAQAAAITTTTTITAAAITTNASAAAATTTPTTTTLKSLNKTSSIVTGEQLASAAKSMGTPGRKGLPLPQAVARRNARERNRVKQVNNGFAALRERIPEEVSEAFEAQGAGRGASKKLSKVETLRMAVEYIRSLERLLGFDFPPIGCHSNSSSSGDDSFMFIKDEFDGLDEHFDDSMSNYEVEEPLSIESITQSTLIAAAAAATATTTTRTNECNINSIDLLPNLTTLNGLQYVRIPGTNTYQLLTTDSQSLVDALIDANCLSNGPAAAIGNDNENGECVKFSSTLSRSPVPGATAQAQAPAIITTTETTTTTTAAAAVNSPCTSPIQMQHGSSSSSSRSSSSSSSSSSLHQPPTGTNAVSPVAVANELLLQACAAAQSSQLIKQEYSNTISSPTNTTINYQGQQQQQQQHQHQHQQHHQQQQQQHQQQHDQQQLLCSPILPAFYDQEPVVSFYDNVVVGLPSFKKEFNDIIHDQSNTTAAGCLSDESMIDAIDWWEAHTPKSDNGANDTNIITTNNTHTHTHTHTHTTTSTPITSTSAVLM